MRGTVPRIFTARVRCVSGRLGCESKMILYLRPRGSENYNITASRLNILTKTRRVRNALFKGNREAKGMSVIALTVGLCSRKISPRLSFSGLPRVERGCRAFAEVGMNRERPCTKSLIFSTFSNSRRSTVSGNVT